mmetsp:Transcript_39771/g.93697  ORF Transcript_39771/g.93697 Transcript_39771/m.93697 type:complete len:491 (+) Transcript_39771:77-1549(+)
MGSRCPTSTHLRRNLGIASVAVDASGWESFTQDHHHITKLLSCHLAALGPHAASVNQPCLGHALGLHGGDLQEALGTHRIEAIGGLHGSIFFEVDGVRAVLEREEVHVALVHAHLHLAGGRLRQLPDGVDGHSRGGVEVAAVVDLVRDVLGHVFEERGGSSVQDRLVDVSQRCAQQAHAGSLVDASRLGAEDAVLERVRDADAVASGDFVRLLQHLERAHLGAVQSHTSATLEGQLELLHLVWGILGPYAHHWIHDGHWGFHGFQVLSLIAQATDVGIGRIPLLGLRDDGVVDVVLVQKGQHLRSARELLEQHWVTPRGVDLEGWVHDVDIPLEADLVVAATGGAVRQDCASMLLHLVQQTSGGDVPADAGGLPVSSIVHGHARDGLEGTLRNVILEVDNNGLYTGGRHLLDHIIDVLLIGLPDVCSEAFDLHAGQTQPESYCLGVQTPADADAESVTGILVALEDAGLLQTVSACNHIRQTSDAAPQRL